MAPRRCLWLVLTNFTAPWLWDCIAAAGAAGTSLPISSPLFFSPPLSSSETPSPANSTIPSVRRGRCYKSNNSTAPHILTQCCLSGNFNGVESDDVLGRDGRRYLDVEELGASWRLNGGTDRQCDGRSSLFLRPSKNVEKLSFHRGELQHLRVCLFV